MAYLSVYMAIAWHPEQHLLADLGLVLAGFLVSFCTTVFHVTQNSIESKCTLTLFASPNSMLCSVV